MKKYLGGVVIGMAWVAFIGGLYGQAPANVLPESDPLVKAWVPPVYPVELKEAKVTGRVTVRFIVDEKGAVSSVRAAKSSDPRFEAAAVASVAQWTFDPGISEGAPRAMGVGVTLFFRLPEKHGSVPPQESTVAQLPKGDAKPESLPKPEYPAELRTRQIGGQVVVDFVVQPDGSISGLRLMSVSHPAFVRPALEAAAGLKFSPAMQGDLPVAARVRSPMDFDPVLVKGDDITRTHLEANGFELRLAEGQSQRDLCERPPVLWSLPDPVYPRAEALAGTAGEAVVDFEIDERGNPDNIRLVSATAPEFGHVLMDTLASASFKPAMKDGRGVGAPLRWKYVFKQPAAEPVEGETQEDRLIRMLRAGQAVPSPKGLDGKLKPLSRVVPEYPKELRAEGLKGAAEIEFIIDREGRVRLPYAASATHEKFGRSAVIAASLWVFEPPTRGGQPTDVRVRVPFQFAP